MYTPQYKSSNDTGKLEQRCPAHAILTNTSYLSVTGFLTVLGPLRLTVKKQCFLCSLGSQFCGAHANIINEIFHTRLTSWFTLFSTK